MSNQYNNRYNRYQTNPLSESNALNYSGNRYNEVYNELNNAKLSIEQEKNIEYEEVVHYVSISSRDRDYSVYPNVNRYVVNFPTEFKNVSNIQLIQAIIPDQNNVRSEPYLLLKIDELEDVMVSRDRNVSDAFAMIMLSSPPTPGGFISMDTKIHENTVKYFRIPKASLSKMTVSITDCDGVLFDFGESLVSPATPGKSYQNTFVFKVTVLEKKRMSLSHRNVY